MASIPKRFCSIVIHTCHSYSWDKYNNQCIVNSLNTLYSRIIDIIFAIGIINSVAINNCVHTTTNEHDIANSFIINGNILTSLAGIRCVFCFSSQLFRMESFEERTPKDRPTIMGIIGSIFDHCNRNNLSLFHQYRLYIYRFCTLIFHFPFMYKLSPCSWDAYLLWVDIQTQVSTKSIM